MQIYYTHLNMICREVDSTTINFCIENQYYNLYIQSNLQGVLIQIFVDNFTNSEVILANFVSDLSFCNMRQYYEKQWKQSHPHPHPNIIELFTSCFEMQFTLHTVVSLTELLHFSNAFHNVFTFHKKRGKSVVTFIKIFLLLLKL